ncbi:MAG: HDOD domain-containing protein [Candidatus Marinimicrobia bacterium]|nr:HDOD domain-containing protein [Candidatus Neomarinimicrobiota bacterium]
MNTILFVDDEKRVLNGIKRLLYSRREEWEMIFITSGEKALKIIQNNKIDVIVADIYMPEMDGIELFKIIKAEYPMVLRVGLSGIADQNLNLKALHLVHQYLPKPCQKNTLINTLERSLAIKNIMESSRVRKIISQLNSLPSLPSMYYEIMNEVNNEHSSIRDIGKIVSKDISMSTKVLQLINSAYFGLKEEITDPTQACIYLGLETLKSLVLTVKIFDKFKRGHINETYIDDLWEHSLKVARYSEKIAEKNNLGTEQVRNYWTAGLLHDIGKLVIAANFYRDFQKIKTLVIEEGKSLLEAENHILGANHGEIGAYLLGLWGLPTPLISTCAFHHYPERYNAKDISPVNIVHFANAIEHQNNRVNQKLEDNKLLKQDYFESLGLTNQLFKWEEICKKAVVKTKYR